MSNPDRDALVNELLEAAYADIEATHYPEGVSNAAKNLAMKRIALVPTPLLVSNRQNVVNLVLWACAETELEISALIEEETPDRFDSVSKRPNQNTSGKCSLLLVGDLFVNDNQVYALVSDVTSDRIEVAFMKQEKIETLNMPGDLLVKMLAERGYKRMT